MTSNLVGGVSNGFTSVNKKQLGELENLPRLNRLLQLTSV